MNQKFSARQISKKIAIVVTLIMILLIPIQKVQAGDGAFRGRPYFFHLEDPSVELDPDFQLMTEIYYMIYLDLVNLNSYYPIADIYLFAQIINLQTLATIWSYESTVSSVPPDGSFQINTSEYPITFDNPGFYRLIAENTPEYDEDPSNNTLIFDFEVFAPTPPPGLPIDIFPNQVDFQRPFDIPNSRTGFFEFNLPPPVEPMFINVMGQQKDGPSESGIWLVQNMPVFPFPDNQNLSTFVNLEPIGVEDGIDLDVMEVDIQYTTDALNGKWDPAYWYIVNVGNITYNVESDNGIESDPDPDFPSVIDKMEWGNPAPITWHYRGCEVPNIDLISTTYNPTNSPGYAGDKNACGPSSCANSMQWLEDKNDNIPANGQTHREKMNDLSSLMERENEKGVNTDQMVKGKLAYIDKHKLPIHVKYQSYFLEDDSVKSPNASYKHFADNQTGAGGKPDFNWIKNEMEKGEDVEIMFGWYDNAGVRHGGHWVVLSGVSDVGTGKGLYFKDDLDQTNEEGNRQVFVNWVENDDGWSRLAGLQGANNNCWVESAISESYDPSVSFELLDPKIKKINYEGTFPNPFGLNAFFDFSYLPRDEGAYLNVFMKANETSIDLWNIRNLFLPPFANEQSLSTIFSLADLGFNEGDDITSLLVNWFVSDEPVIEEKEVKRSWFKEMFLGVFDYIKKLNTEDNDLADEFDFKISIDDFEPSVFIDGYQTRWHYRGCEVPNIDLDSSKYNPTKVPGYAGDVNACVPAATANSMQWLENKHPQIKTNLTHREKLVELSKLMKRENNEGTSTSDFIKGKLAYIDKYKLPIRVKFQSKFYGTEDVAAEDTTYNHKADNRNTAAQKSPDFEFLMKEIKEDEDVEIIYGYYTRDSTKRDGGHCITVTGVSDVGTAKGFYFKDDGNQVGENGMGQTYVNWDTVNGWVALKNLYTDTHFALVESVVSESYDSTITYDIQNPKVERIEHKGDPILNTLTKFEVPQGIFSFDFIPSNLPRYLNLIMRTEEGAKESWIVRNLFLPPFDYTERFDTWFDFSQLGLSKDLAEKLSTVEVAIEVTETTMAEIKTLTPSWIELAVDAFEYVVYLSTEDNEESITITPVKKDTTQTHHGVKQEHHARGEKMPNIDLDSTTYNPETVNGYAGDVNACGPAAAANSMQWLDNEFSEINSGISHREKLKELSEFMSRKDNRGVKNKNFIEGKLKYIDKHKLPIKVKFQSKWLGKDSVSAGGNYGHSARNDNATANAFPTFEYLKKEIEDDEDVEISYGYYDSDGKRDGGHVVTVSGVESNENSQRVHIKDDLKQNIAGGTRQQVVSWKVKDGKPYFHEISGGKFTCFIESVVSESQDTSVKFIDPPEIIGVRVIDQFIEDTKNVVKDKLSILINPIYEGLKYINIFGGSDDKPLQVVRNLPLDGSTAESPEIMIDRGAFANGILKSAKVESTIKLGIIVSDKPIENDTIPSKWIDVNIENGNYLFTNDAPNSNVIHRDIATRNILPSISTNGEIQLLNVPVVDLDNETNPNDAASGYQGDLFGGGSAALSSAMLQLDQFETGISFSLNQRELLELHSIIGGRQSETGVSTAQLIVGGLGVIDSLQQQVAIEFQSQANDGDLQSSDDRYDHSATDVHTKKEHSPDWSWIGSKLSEGSVIISYGIYSDNGTRDAGQWAVVNGIYEDNSNKTLILSLDMDQANEGGVTNMAVSWMEDGDDAYLYQLSSSTATCWVESAVALSFDGTLTFETTGIEVLGTANNLIVFRNPSTVSESVTIQFKVDDYTAPVEIVVYDLTGRVLRSIEPEIESSGIQTIFWDGTDQKGNILPTGNYVIGLRAGSNELSIKILRK